MPAGETRWEQEVTSLNPRNQTYRAHVLHLTPQDW
uniref:Uncharacterized protein n=1 Tax=Anguilla anguilla TaxID=7936 RepID=A0A0E9W3L5_ANGAN